MATNYYSVVEITDKLMPRMVISFTDKVKAQNHADILNRTSVDMFEVLPSTIELYFKVKQ